MIKINKINFPVVLKPTNEGSSLGVKICNKTASLFRSISNLFKKNYEELIIEVHWRAGDTSRNNKWRGTEQLSLFLRLFYDYKAKYTKKLKQNM